MTNTKMTPREPTPEMVEDGMRSDENHRPDYVAIWRAMWYAAPGVNPSAADNVGADILSIMEEYDRQSAAGFVDTPGGLEHMGDVWRLLTDWASMLRLPPPDAERGA